MNRLSVLVAASHPSVKNAVDQVLGTRNYRILHAPIGDGLPTLVEAQPHELAIIAPDDDDEALAAARAYRERARLAKVRVIVLASADLRDRAKALGDHVVDLGPDLADNPFDRDALLGALDQATRHLITILVADDEPLIRRMFEMYFTNEGYRIATAEDGLDAIQRVQEVKPDLVITDIQMPGVDGYEVCRAVKENRKTAHIPVIIVSALGNDIDIDKGFNAGANEYVTKPVDLNELSGRIQAIFRGIARRGRERILVVTQSQIERSILEYGLRQQGFDVVTAGSGEQALEVAAQQTPSVMIADQKIPGLELGVLADRLRQQPRTRDLPIVVLTTAASKIDRATRAVLKAADYLTKPFPMERLVVCIERILGERRSNLEREREFLLQAIRTLIHTLEARDSYTRGHSESVARWTKLIARKVLSSPEEIARFELSAQLHDIGKIGVPDAILLKPGKLDEEEMRIMQTHPSVGADILTPILSLQDILPGVRWHHERIDGRGYPDKLPGPEIPLMARMIAVADTYDALTSDRPYRKGCTIEKALGIIREVAGTQLDAELVKVFVDVVAEEGGRSTKTSQPAVPVPAAV